MILFGQDAFWNPAVPQKLPAQGGACDNVIRGGYQQGIIRFAEAEEYLRPRSNRVQPRRG